MCCFAFDPNTINRIRDNRAFQSRAEFLSRGRACSKRKGSDNYFLDDAHVLGTRASLFVVAYHVSAPPTPNQPLVSRAPLIGFGQSMRQYFVHFRNLKPRFVVTHAQLVELSRYRSCKGVFAWHTRWYSTRCSKMQS